MPALTIDDYLKASSSTPNTGPGSTDTPTNTVLLPQTGAEQYNQYANQMSRQNPVWNGGASNPPIPTPVWNPGAPTPVWNPGITTTPPPPQPSTEPAPVTPPYDEPVSTTPPTTSTQNTTNQTTTNQTTTPGGLNSNSILKQKWDLGTKYANAVASFDKGDIVDKMRIRTGGTADIDSAIQKLKIDQNKSRPELMKRYASIIDPKQREALISAEESSIAKQIVDLQAVKTYREGSIRTMIEGEVARGEQKLKALEAQYNLYSDVLLDVEKAQRFEKDMEKTALEIQQKRLELQSYSSDKALENKGRQLDINGKELEIQQKRLNLENYSSDKQLENRGKQLDIIGKESESGVTWIPGETQYGNTDFSSLGIGGASIKNNNPSNIKFNPSGFNQALDKAGIKYTKGTGATDGGNFIKFNSVEDGLVARTMLLTGGSYANKTVEQAMRRWSNNGYGAEVAPEINGNKLIKDLSKQELTKLMLSQIKREDVTMYNQLVKSGIDPAKYTKEAGYQKTGTSKKDIENKIKTIQTADEFLQLQANSSDNLVGKLTPIQADAILQSDYGKFRLGSKADKLLDIASDTIQNDYIIKEKINELSQMTDVGTVVGEIKKLQKDLYTDEEIKSMLTESGILNKEGFKKGFFNDDAGLDKLQELLPNL